MNLKMTLGALALSAAIGGLALDAQACSTVIVGKDVSATGQIIIGHNEDNGGRILSAQYWVPAEDHKAGEMITYEPTAAKIPQVEHTFAFYWSQTYDPAGSSFSDGFVNENGVVIVSNACSGNFEDDKMELTDGGIGYGIRRLMAERATSARHAVEIATELLGKYGYFSEGRTYTIADHNEAWQLAIHQGNTWAARRVKDNEIVYIPNNFMMDDLDVTDTENVKVAPGTVERAIKNGRYKPAKEGVYDHFNYRYAVQPASSRSADYNFNRNQLAWEKITGKKITDPEKFPYSATPNKKWTIEDVKDLLRTHEDTIGQDPGWYHIKGLGLCRPTTHESVVYEINENPLLIAGYRALARPCETAYVPFFPVAHPAEGAHFLDWKTATAEQFKGTPEHFSYNPNWQVFNAVELANTVDYQYDSHAENFKFVQGLEKAWAKDHDEVMAKARALLKTNPKQAERFLNQYNVSMFNDAQHAMKMQQQKLQPHKISLLTSVIDPKGDGKVEVVLYSDKTLDATKVDVANTHLGLSRASVGKTGLVSNLAKPVKTEARDFNGDGKMDMVFTFNEKDVTLDMIAGATYDVWFYSYDQNKKKISAFDEALIKTEGYKGPAERKEAADC